MSIIATIGVVYGVSWILWLFVNPYLFIRFYGHDSYKDAITYKREPTFFKMFWFALTSPVHSTSIIFAVLLDIQLKLGKLIESKAIKDRTDSRKETIREFLEDPVSKEEVERALQELERVEEINV